MLYDMNDNENLPSNLFDTWVFETSIDRTIWIPYLQAIEKNGSLWLTRFQGGELDIDLAITDTVMIYGYSGDLPVAFLLDASKTNTTVIIHSRYNESPLIFEPLLRVGKIDVLQEQILFRTNERKRAVIAKECVLARLRQMNWLIDVPASHIKNIKIANGVNEVRQYEAQYSKIYWERYFSCLGYPDYSRRGKNPISDALNACSLFLVGPILRWIYLHRLSPSHGYLHVQTTYNALVYDLMEPVRHWPEKIVFQLVKNSGEDKLTAKAINRLKESLNQVVEVPNFQCEVKRKNLMHANVLALRAYLLRDMTRLVFPRDSEGREKGKPVKASFIIPGSKKRYR